MSEIKPTEIEQVREFLLNLQTKIISMLETFDNTKFIDDKWDRSEGGGGITCLLENGSVFDKVGVNFSDILGEKLPAAATNIRPDLQGRNYRAMGVSVVSHPKNPNVPTVHLNVRLFVAFKKDSDVE